jgi:hypothetical protein
MFEAKLQTAMQEIETIHVKRSNLDGQTRDGVEITKMQNNFHQEIQ